MQINIRLFGKICREMGRKNVPEDRRSDTASEQGIPAKLFNLPGNKDTGFTKNCPFFRRTLSERQHCFCPWTVKTEKQKPAVPGTFSQISGTTNPL